MKKIPPNVISKRNYKVDNVKAGREYIKAYINFVVYTHHLYAQVKESSGKGVHEKKGRHTQG